MKIYGRTPVIALGLAAAFAPLLGGCGPDTSDCTIPIVREVPGAVPTAQAPSAERFGDVRRVPPSADAGDALTSMFRFDAPAGWERVEPTPLRWLNFRVPGGAECYLSMVESGDVTANVNRWRGQLGLQPLDDAQIAALPRHPLMRLEGTYVDLQGTLKAMNAPAIENAGLLGLFASIPNGGLTLKLTGPIDAVNASREAFLALAASLQLNGVSDGPRDAAANAAAAFDPRTLQWTLPAGWTEVQGSSMRVATFDTGDAECWITVLPGDAGGVEANLNRWRREMGLEPLGSAQLAALPRLAILGHDGFKLSIQGPYRGMGGTPSDDAQLLGVVCPLADAMLFVKLVGPRAPTVAASDARSAAFDAFCQSLRTRDAP